MKRNILVLSLIFGLLFAFSAIAKDADQAGKAKLVDKNSVQLVKLGKSALHSRVEADDPVIFEDDMEDAVDHWTPGSNWDAVDLTAGRTFHPQTHWNWVDDNGSSATHSWNAVEDNSEVDLLVSPIISLPEEVETGGVSSPLKGLKIGHMLDVDTPGGAAWAGGTPTGENWSYVLGPVEVWWDLSGTLVAEGTSAYYFDPTHGSTDKFWQDRWYRRRSI